MLNYYDELKNDIMEVLEDEGSKEYMFLKENRDLPKNTIYDYLVDYMTENDSITGNASGSYYMNSYKSRKHCYNYASDVKEALEVYGYKKDFELFKTFESLADEHYINVDTMGINDDALYDEDPEYRWYIVNNFESIKELNFEKLDVITRCYKLYKVVADIVKKN